MNWTNIAETDRQRIASWQKWMLTLAILCEMFLAADWYAFAAVLPFVSETLKLNPAEAGLAQGIFALTVGIGMVVWSPHQPHHVGAQHAADRACRHRHRHGGAGLRGELMPSSSR